MKTQKSQFDDSLTALNNNNSNTLRYQNLAPDISLRDIVKTLPPECFNRNYRKSWTQALINSLVVLLCYYGLATLPWFFLPFLWITIGTALAGFFSLGHDCGHYSFAKQRWINELLGHFFLLPVIYPFHNWCLEHNSHHNRTNRLGGSGWKQVHDIVNGEADPYWQPFRVEVYDKLTPITRRIYQLIRGPFWWLATTLNWWNQLNIDVSKLPQKDRLKVRLSIAIVLLFSAIVFPTLIITTGLWGFIKFWLIPWLIFHFWFGTFTLIHHTFPDNKNWKSEKDWNAAQAQLCGTVHCKYPWWVEFLCHDINYHVPHHISTAIPSYNLRMAHKSLQQNWGTYLRECDFSWSLIREITSQCHLYNYAEEHFKSFQESSDS